MDSSQMETTLMLLFVLFLIYLKQLRSSRSLPIISLYSAKLSRLRTVPIFLAIKNSQRC